MISCKYALSPLNLVTRHRSPCLIQDRNWSFITVGTALRPVSVEEVMRKFSRITHHLYCIGLRDDLLSLSMHRVITQFHRFLYIFNCRMLVGHLCLKIESTCLSGRSRECHS
jgi:hypothetical protein